MGIFTNNQMKQVINTSQLQETWFFEPTKRYKICSNKVVKRRDLYSLGKKVVK